MLSFLTPVVCTVSPSGSVTSPVVTDVASPKGSNSLVPVIGFSAVSLSLAT